MKKKTKVLRIIIVILVLVALTVFIISLITQRVAKNPAGTVGNTAGNLNNSGLFCETDGTVYFSNLHDNGRLYSMSPDESDVKRINDLQVRNLLSGGKYIYFFQSGATDGSGLGSVVATKAFMQLDPQRGRSTSMTKDTVITGQLVDNYLYLLTSVNNSLSFYKMKIDRSDTVELANYEINPSCAANGVIYYSGTQDNHYLYSLNTATDTSQVYWAQNIWYPVLDGYYIYYMDLNSDYHLCRYSISDQRVEVLTEDRVDCFNVGNGYIYYQKNGDTPQLICMRTDGTDKKVIADGNYTDINMTSRYVYFRPFKDNHTCYHSPLGSSGYSEFAPER